MSLPPATLLPVRPAPPKRRPTGLLLAITAVAVVLVGVGGYGFYHLFLEQGPAPVGTAGPVVPSGAPAAPLASTDGTWTIDPTIGSFGDFTSAWVGYRVKEVLGSIGAATAVGRTPDVTGGLTLEGAVLMAVDVTADLTTLTSDERLRDGQLGHQGIQTDQFPEASFTLTRPIDLGEIPADGEGISATGTGDLTFHGVTKSVEIPLTATLRGDVIGVSGSVEIAFADFNIPQPSSFKVLSIEDHGIMEFQLFFRHD